MKAVRVDRFGGPEALGLRDLPDPVAEPGRAVVEVAVAGVNFYDVYRRRGDYGGPLPYVPGIEGVGVVVDGGGGPHPPGTRVAWVNEPGAYAEAVSLPVERLVPLGPDAPDDQRVAAHLLQGMTAHYLTHDTFAVRPGTVVVVQAAGGGTGSLVVQRARHLGARVVAVASSEEKASRAREAGAHEVLSYGDDLAAAVRDLGDGRGADVVYDGVGGPTFDAGLAALRPRGTMVVFGQAGGVVAPVDLQRLNVGGSLFVTRPNLDHHIASPGELAARAAAVLAEIAAGVMTARVDRVLPLAEAAHAHRLLGERRAHGKLLLTVKR